MKKKIVKAIRKEISVIPGGMTYSYFGCGAVKLDTLNMFSGYEKVLKSGAVNHKRRAKRIYKREGMQGVENYVLRNC